MYKIGKYAVIDVLGQGSFCSVYLGKNMETMETVAMKFFKREKFSSLHRLSNIEREIRIMESISHPNIVRHIETIYIKDYIILVMENLDEGTLGDLKEKNYLKLDNSKCMRWGKEILQGLSYLHKRGISHHDIKPENIGFDYNLSAKIIDFGLCEDTTFFRNIKECSLICGTAFYLAPEVLKKKDYDGEKADIWSFGVTFHYMVTGEIPFEEMTAKEYLGMSDIKQKISIKCKGTARKIVERALQIDPKKRPTAEELLNSGLFSEAETYIFNEHIPKSAVSKFVRKSSKPAIFVPKLQQKNSILNKASSVLVRV